MLKLCLIVVVSVQAAKAEKITVQDLLDHNRHLRVESLCGMMEEILPKIRRMGFDERGIALLSPKIQEIGPLSATFSNPLQAMLEGGITIPQADARKMKADITKAWEEKERNMRLLLERLSTEKTNKLIMKFQLETPMEWMYLPPLADELDLDDMQREEIYQHHIKLVTEKLRIMREFGSGRGKGSRSAKDKAARRIYFYSVFGLLDKDQLLRFFPMTRDIKRPPKDAEGIMRLIAKDDFKTELLRIPKIKEMWDASEVKKKQDDAKANAEADAISEAASTSTFAD